MTIPPIILPEKSYSDQTGAEKRTPVRLKKYWDFIRKEKNFPDEKDIDSTKIHEIWNSCFIVKADNSCKREDYKFNYIGKNIIKAYGSDLNGLCVASIVSPQAEYLADKYERVLATKHPVVQEGEILLSKNELIKYRQILLPVGDSLGINVTAILGGMTYKVVKLGKKSIFSRLTGKK